MTDLWAEEATKGTNREHGLHADAPEKAGATHVPRDARCGSPLLIPSALRARAPARAARSTMRTCIIMCRFVSLSAVSSRCENDPPKAGAGRSSRRSPRPCNGRKPTTEAIKRDTAWLERLRARGQEALLPTAYDCFRLARPREHYAYLYHYPG